MARVILSEQTADRIRQLIERQYKPGDRIPAEMELAEFLGVSRTTIREAVKILCSRNILEIRRGHGTFVCENPGLPADPFGSKDMDEEQLKADIFEMSLLLEPELVRLAARKASDESIVRMKEILYIKVFNCSSEDKVELFQIAETFKARVIDYGKDSLLLEFVQTATKNDAVVKLIKEEFGRIEVVRGGSVGIESISMMER